MAPITGDAGQLYQVLVNVVANAAQGIGQLQGRNTVRLQEEAERSQLCR